MEKVSYIIGIVIVMSFSLILLSCHVLFVPDSDDLRFEQLHLVVESENKNVDLLGKAMRPGEKLLKVEFSSETDLGTLFHHSQVQVREKVWLCANGEEAEVPGWYDVYFETFSLSRVRFSKQVREQYQAMIRQEPHNVRYIYHIYIQYQRGSYPIHPGWVVYDLKKYPQNVCFRLWGGNMLGGQYSSNTVVIPKSVIAKAFDSVKE